MARSVVEGSAAELASATTARPLPRSITNAERKPPVPPLWSRISRPGSGMSTAQPSACSTRELSVFRRTDSAVVIAAPIGEAGSSAAAANLSMSSPVERIAPAPASDGNRHGLVGCRNTS
jgi:hypothetical protein